MAGAGVHERLRQARSAAGEDVGALSRRTGVRPQHLHAIEEGRFGDLPPGIYARAAIRSFAAAYGLEAGELLSASAPLLPVLDDPICALADKYGVRHKTVEPLQRAAPCAGSRNPGWRELAATAIDAAIVGAIEALLVGGAALLSRTPPDRLNSAAPPLALVGLALGAMYFTCFGALGEPTPGGVALHLPRRRPAAVLTLAAMAEGALRSASQDLRGLRDVGRSVGYRGFRPGAAPDSARRSVPSPSRLRPHDRGPART